MITGAGGFLGGELLNQIIEDTDYFAVAITSQPHKLYEKFGKERLVCYGFEDINNDIINWQNIDTIVHCAFARSQDGKELAVSLERTKLLFEKAYYEKVRRVINISSQGVYGQSNKPLWKENTRVAPDSLYALSKYNSELMAELINILNETFISNLRLPGLTGGREGLRLEIVSRFVTNAINKEPIKIIGGKQVFSNMDVRDAASGILALIKTDRKKWKKVYNLGCEWRHSIIEIAEIVKEIAKEYNKNVKIVIEEKDVYLDSGMDSTLFYKDTGWKPKYNMKDIVKNLFDYLTEEKND